MDYQKIQTNFEKKGYTFSAFEDDQDVINYLKDALRGKTVGFGGSQTLTGLDLRHALADECTLYVPDFAPNGENFHSISRKAIDSDVYLLSANGATVNGEIVNIDGIGNRLAGSLFGHKKVYYVIGENKISDTLEDAIARARNIAGPKNALRLHRKTPCAMAVQNRLQEEYRKLQGYDELDQLKWQKFIEDLDVADLGTHCYDCNSPDRICSSLLVHWNRPYSMDAEIIFIKKRKGF